MVATTAALLNWPRAPALGYAALSPGQHAGLAIAGPFALLGLIFLLIGLALVLRQHRFRSRSLSAQGAVISLRAVGSRSVMTGSGSGTGLGASLSYRPTVRFTTAAGRAVEAEARVATNPPAGRPGDAVTVYYDPADPFRFSTSAADRITGCVAIACLVVGGAVFALATVVLASILT